jgi:pantetheine-phosphate adenylyltransferase
MIEQGSRIFDELVVAVGVNPQKKTSYPLDLRIEMLKESLAGIINVTVVSFNGQFLVDFAKSTGAGFILRGIRGETDFEYERGMRYINDRLAPDLSTVFLIPPKELVETSSSIVKSLIGPAGWPDVVKQFVPRIVFKQILISEMRAHFYKLFSSITQISIDSLWDEVLHKYSEDSRHYHGLNHIAECLSELYTIDLPAREQTTIAIAIWFHDIIYNPKSKTNEEDSADYFRAQAKLFGLSSDLVETVSDYILATKRHEVEKPCSDRSLQLFLDIDLSILGADECRFMDYDKAIKAEYGWVPKLIYGPKRKKVLKGFLDRPFIFQTPEFRERYEEQARKNLKRIVDD